MGAEEIYKTPEGKAAIMAWYDGVLARWPVPCEAMTVRTRVGDTFVMASGKDKAPPIVLLHGAATNSAMWLSDAAVFGRAYRVYAVDLSGEPGRTVPVYLDWYGDAFAEWLDEALDYLFIDEAALIGMSQGGWVALKYAIFRPERVGRMVLLAPGGITRDRVSFALLASSLKAMGTFGADQMDRLLYGPLPVPEEARTASRLIAQHFRPRMGVPPLFSDKELKRVTMPTLLVIGENDPLRNATKVAGRLHRLVPKLTPMMIPRAGHMLYSIGDQILPYLSATDPL